MKRILTISILLLAVIFTVSADRRGLLMTGNVASAFTPSSLGLSIEYDVDLLALSDGTAIDTLTDQSANAWHAMSSGSARPIWTNNVSVINNRGFAWFDATDDMFQTNFTTTLAQSNYVWLVMARRSTVGDTYFFDSGSSGAARNALLLSGGYGFSLFAGSGPIAGPVPLAVDTWYLAEFGFSGANSFVLTNGVTMTNGLSIGAQGLQGITVGARFGGTTFNQCNIAYLAIKNGAITPTQISDMRTYLKARFGTP